MNAENPQRNSSAPGRTTRRRFLVGLLLSAPLLYVGGWWLWWIRKTDCRPMVAAILKKKLHYLDLDAEGVKRFASDIQPHIAPRVRSNLAWLQLGLPVYSGIDYTRRWGREKWYRKVEWKLITQYLMSTDFFQNDANESRKIRYLMYYDPYSRPCANPFPRFDFDA